MRSDTIKSKMNKLILEAGLDPREDRPANLSLKQMKKLIEGGYSSIGYSDCKFKKVKE